jgi:hypothetical protein
MMVEGSLVAGVSCADISLIPPHKYDQPVSFELTGDKQGAVSRRSADVSRGSRPGADVQQRVLQVRL